MLVIVVVYRDIDKIFKEERGGESERETEQRQRQGKRDSNREKQVERDRDRKQNERNGLRINLTWFVLSYCGEIVSVGWKQETNKVNFIVYAI